MKEETGIRIKYPTEYPFLIRKNDRNIKEKIYNKESLDLTNSIIEYCPSNYSVWIDRRSILENIPAEEYKIEEEIDWIKYKAKYNQKNYQIWNHFRYVLERTKHKIEEDEEILEIAKEEPKNIHFWGVFLNCTEEIDRGIEYTGYFIEQDIRNNSAYSIRYALIKKEKDRKDRKNRKDKKNNQEKQEKQEDTPNSPTDTDNPTDQSVLTDRPILERQFLLSLPILKHNTAYWNYAYGLDRLFPGHEIVKYCELALKSKEVPKYYED